MTHLYERIYNTCFTQFVYNGSFNVVICWSASLFWPRGNPTTILLNASEWLSLQKRTRCTIYGRNLLVSSNTARVVLCRGLFLKNIAATHFASHNFRTHSFKDFFDTSLLFSLYYYRNHLAEGSSNIEQKTYKVTHSLIISTR